MCRVLVVDDEPHHQKLMQWELEDAGYDVAVAGEGDQALRMISTFTPDVVVLGVGQHGADIVARIRALKPSGPPKGRLKLVVHTADCGPGTGSFGPRDEDTVDGFVVKSSDFSRLRHAIATLCPSRGGRLSA